MDHEMQVAANAGMLGSIDANRGDYQNAWDTDQFPYNINETVEMMLVLLRSGGFQGGGVNFDAKRRRNSTDLSDTLDRKSTRLNSSHVAISYADFCLKKT